MDEPKYKRVLLKISGEALAGDKHFGLDFQVMGRVADVIKECSAMGVEIGVVIGGGNFWRGVKNGEGYIERTRADHMGMLATAMNCMAVADVLEQKGVDVRVQTALEIKEVAEPYIRARAIRHLEKGRVVLFGCGIGSPFFSTDTAAVLRAAEINADVILLAKNIDGVYNADPAKDASAVKYDAISYEDVLAQHLAVMDSTATSLSMDNHIPVLVFALKDPYNIVRALRGEKIEFIAKFLRAIFADLRKSGLEHRQYLRAGFEFCCAHKPNFGRIAAGFVCCFRNFIANTAIIFRSLSRSVLFV